MSLLSISTPALLRGGSTVVSFDKWTKATGQGVSYTVDTSRFRPNTPVDE